MQNKKVEEYNLVLEFKKLEVHYPLCQKCGNPLLFTDGYYPLRHKCRICKIVYEQSVSNGKWRIIGDGRTYTQNEVEEIKKEERKRIKEELKNVVFEYHKGGMLIQDLDLSEWFARLVDKILETKSNE